ncbi:UNVERIFIED_CONTAM: hypothetical protein Scaly_0610000 [Sesamum calycinum]|uniref:DUF4216 domain-containing protein n=1 Tax=Sesamum calycinum TaxID=2727403 RepID=A0AAW2RTG3_9LAMI
MDGDKIRCLCRKCKNAKFGTADEDYFETPSVPQVSEEPIPTGHVEGVPHNGTRSCPVGVGPSSYCYGGDPYDYDESGLADRFSDVVHVVNQPLILPSDHTLLGDCYNTKKLVKDLSLPVEKIHSCKDDCMLYWKDDVDLEYCKFCGDARSCILLTNPLIPNLHIVLFKYRWVDPVRGMKVHLIYHLVDVNFKKLYQNDDPFIIAQQAVQVYFTKYPIAYQLEEVVPVPIVAVDNQSYNLRDPNGVQVVLEAVEEVMKRHGGKVNYGWGKYMLKFLCERYDVFSKLVSRSEVVWNKRLKFESRIGKYYVNTYKDLWVELCQLFAESDDFDSRTLEEVEPECKDVNLGKEPEAVVVETSTPEVKVDSDPFRCGYVSDNPASTSSL